MIYLLVLGCLAFLCLLKIYFSIDCDFTLLFYSYFGKRLDKLSNKVVFITGSSSGIGAHLAYEFAKLNCKLIICGTNLAKLESVKEKCISLMKNKNENDVLLVQFDITDFNLHKEVFFKVIKHFSKIDILINNAGKSQRAFFKDIDLKVDKEIFDINVFGAINLTRIVLNHWYETNSKGHLIAISSTAGICGVPFSASYAASKHSLNGYFETIRLESYHKGIRVTVICPGPVYSNIGINALTDKLGEKANIVHQENKRRIQTSRCAYLILVSIINQLDVTWIALNPVLFFHYLNQYFPSISKFILTRFLSNEYFMKLRDSK